MAIEATPFAVDSATPFDAVPLPPRSQAAEQVANRPNRPSGTAELVTTIEVSVQQPVQMKRLFAEQVDDGWRPRLELVTTQALGDLAADSGRVHVADLSDERIVTSSDTWTVEVLGQPTVVRADMPVEIEAGRARFQTIVEVAAAELVDDDVLASVPPPPSEGEVAAIRSTGFRAIAPRSGADGDRRRSAVQPVRRVR
ncbi:MAG: hypothetical protein R3B90_12430 [Planctomycetaceae bacterium]